MYPFKVPAELLKARVITMIWDHDVD